MNLVSLLITIIVLGLVFYLLWWLLGRIALPPPFKVVAEVVLALICVVLLLGLLFGSISLPTLRLG